MECKGNCGENGGITNRTRRTNISNLFLDCLQSAKRVGHIPITVCTALDS